jgi:hypothetical protein
MSWKMSGRVKDIMCGARGEEISGTQKFILLVLADYFNDEEGYAWPSVATLANKCLCSERTVQDSLRHLEHVGLISIEKITGQKSRYYVLSCTPEKSAGVQLEVEDETGGVQLDVKSGDVSIIEPIVEEKQPEQQPAVRPFLHKPEKREKAKKAKPKTWASSGFSNSLSLDEFPTAGRPRHENSRFVPNKQAEALYTLIRTEVQERGDRSPGGMTGPMQERRGELYETHGPEILEKAFWLWWDREGTSLPEDFSRPIALFLKDATGCIAEAAAKRKKPKSEYVSAIDNIPPPPKPTYDHSWEKKYAKQKLSGE